MLQDLKQGTLHLSTNWVEIPEACIDAAIVQLPCTGATSHASTRPTVSTQAFTRGGGAPSTVVTRMDKPTRDAVSRVYQHHYEVRRYTPGSEFCFDWWVRGGGGCFPNCGRRSTHVPFASPAERTRLLDYFRERILAPAAT